MYRIFLAVLLALPLAEARGTFELQDPAREIMDELQAWREREAREALRKAAVCKLEPETRTCSCVHGETGKPVPMSLDECMAKALEPRHPPRP